MGAHTRQTMGCGGTKEKEKPTGDTPAPATAPAPQPAATSAPASSGASSAPASGDAGHAFWISPELGTMMGDYFTRYDLDGSGTINSNDELKQLCTNLVVKLELDMDVGTIDKYVTGAGDMEKHQWNFDQFKDWFLKQFEPLPSWLPNDLSSSDADENNGEPRSGTYDLVMNGQ